MRRWRRWAAYAVLSLALLGLLLAIVAWRFLHASLPQLDGERHVPGLHAAVNIERDRLGVPTIVGKDRADVAYATGFLHAQDRFFQMDLLRRMAAGELSALFGAVALETDTAHRLHRFRARAQQVVATLPLAERVVLERYVAGVNDGLAALGARPFEYGLLRSEPQPWRMEDTMLVVWAMYFDLQGHELSRKLSRGWLAVHSTPEQLAFLLPTASAWDAPLDADKVNDIRPSIPTQGPNWLGFREAPKHMAEVAGRSSIGSNNWALAGNRSQTGSALVANDMHLDIRLPHIWYRADLQFDDAAGTHRRVTGVTLPGAPLIVVGSNGRVAWGFTNSFGDYLDLISVEQDPMDPFRFKLPGGWEKARQRTETIAVKGAADVPLAISDTSLGPIWEVDGKHYVVHWIAHEAGAVNLGLMAMEQAGSLTDALAIGNRAGIPSQNLVAGDAAGHIGWTIAGPLPQRENDFASSLPFDAAVSKTWTSHRLPDDYPRVIDPPAGQLSTANARQLAGPAYAKLGDGGADIGARAQQIRDDLKRLGKTDERGAYGVVLDDRALFVAPWRDRALKALDPASLEGKPKRAELRRLLSDGWDGHASAASVGYRLARGYMFAVYAQLFAVADADMMLADEHAHVDAANLRWFEVAARLLDERPAGWLPHGMRDWHAVELAAIDQMIDDFERKGTPLAQASWGARNTARIAHPFAGLLPALRPWLGAPPDQLAGDENMPRVAAPSFGPSERMVVSPGHEAQGIFNMPGGQSGHPLSPYFLAGHADWVAGEGRPGTFLPGSAEHRLRLTPGG
jgi:penicillin amidase